VHVVMATQHLADVGGSETYLYTVADNLVRLGHQVTVHAQHLGVMADQVRSVGADVVEEDGLPESCDGLLAQDVGMAYTLAARWPDRPQVFVCHSILYHLQTPPALPVPGSVVVTMSDRNTEHVRAMPGGHEVVRLRQPIDWARLAPRGTPADRPRRALLLGNYLADEARGAIVDAWSAAKVEVVQVGTLAQPTLDVAAAIADADIVVGKGRAILEAMSCGRAAFVYDAFGCDGWVTAATYDALEANAFAGQASPTALGPDGLRAALDDYDPTMGLVNRQLVLTHHNERKHVEALVELFRRLGPVADDRATPAAELARLSRLRWRADEESRHLRGQLAETTSRLRETEARLLLSEQRRRRRARAARRAEERLAELGHPITDPRHEEERP